MRVFRSSAKERIVFGLSGAAGLIRAHVPITPNYVKRITRRTFGNEAELLCLDELLVDLQNTLTMLSPQER